MNPTELDRRVDRPRTTPQRRAGKCRALAKQITEEQQRHALGKTRSELASAALQLGYLARAAHALDAATIEAFIETAEDLLARTMIARAFGAKP